MPGSQEIKPQVEQLVEQADVNKDLMIDENEKLFLQFDKTVDKLRQYLESQEQEEALDLAIEEVAAEYVGLEPAEVKEWIIYGAEAITEANIQHIEKQAKATSEKEYWKERNTKAKKEFGLLQEKVTENLSKYEQSLSGVVVMPKVDLLKKNIKMMENFSKQYEGCKVIPKVQTLLAQHKLELSKQKEINYISSIKGEEVIQFNGIDRGKINKVSSKLGEEISYEVTLDGAKLKLSYSDLLKLHQSEGWSIVKTKGRIKRKADDGSKERSEARMIMVEQMTAQIKPPKVEKKEAPKANEQLLNRLNNRYDHLANVLQSKQMELHQFWQTQSSTFTITSALDAPKDIIKKTEDGFVMQRHSDLKVTRYLHPKAISIINSIVHAASELYLLGEVQEEVQKGKNLKQAFQTAKKRVTGRKFEIDPSKPTSAILDTKQSGVSISKMSESSFLEEVDMDSIDDNKFLLVLEKGFKNVSPIKEQIEMSMVAFKTEEEMQYAYGQNMRLLEAHANKKVITEVNGEKVRQSVYQLENGDRSLTDRINGALLLAGKKYEKVNYYTSTGLKKHKSKLVGLLVPKLDDPRKSVRLTRAMLDEEINRLTLIEDTIGNAKDIRVLGGMQLLLDEKLDSKTEVVLKYMEEFAYGIVDIVNDPSTYVMLASGYGAGMLAARLMAQTTLMLAARGIALTARTARVAQVALEGIVFHANNTVGNALIGKMSYENFVKQMTDPMGYMHSVAMLGTMGISGKVFGTLGQAATRNPMAQKGFLVLGEAAGFTGFDTVNHVIHQKRAPTSKEFLQIVTQSIQMTLAFKMLKIGGKEEGHKEAGARALEMNNTKKIDLNNRYLQAERAGNTKLMEKIEGELVGVMRADTILKQEALKEQQKQIGNMGLKSAEQQATSKLLEQQIADYLAFQKLLDLKLAKAETVPGAKKIAEAKTTPAKRKVEDARPDETTPPSKPVQVPSEFDVAGEWRREPTVVSRKRGPKKEMSEAGTQGADSAKIARESLKRSMEERRELREESSLESAARRQEELDFIRKSMQEAQPGDVFRFADGEAWRIIKVGEGAIKFERQFEGEKNIEVVFLEEISNSRLEEFAYIDKEKEASLTDAGERESTPEAIEISSFKDPLAGETMGSKPLPEVTPAVIAKHPKVALSFIENQSAYERILKPKEFKALKAAAEQSIIDGLKVKYLKSRAENLETFFQNVSINKQNMARFQEAFELAVSELQTNIADHAWEFAKWPRTVRKEIPNYKKLGEKAGEQILKEVEASYAKAQKFLREAHHFGHLKNADKIYDVVLKMSENLRPEHFKGEMTPEKYKLLETVYEANLGVRIENVVDALENPVRMEKGLLPETKEATDFYVLSDRGAGGMGMVREIFYLNADGKLTTRLIKTAHPKTRHMFIDESIRLEIVASIGEHPNVMKGAKEILVDEHGNEHIIIEKAGNKDGNEFFSNPKNLTAQNLINLTFNLIAGLQHLHEGGVIHRDLKLGNVMYSEASNSWIIIDLGTVSVQPGPKTDAMKEVLKRDSEKSGGLVHTPNNHHHFRIGREIFRKMNQNREFKVEYDQVSLFTMLGMIYKSLSVAERQNPTIRAMKEQLDKVVSATTEKEVHEAYKELQILKTEYEFLGNQ